MKELGSLAILTTTVGLIWFAMHAARRREEAEEAQSAAIVAVNRATVAFNLADKTFPSYGIIAVRFNELSTDASHDPYRKGLTAQAYRNIARRWETVYNDLVCTQVKVFRVPDRTQSVV